MNKPILIEASGFQEAWIRAVRLLRDSRWQLSNLVVCIDDTTKFDPEVHDRVVEFARRNRLRNPKGVANTIFPRRLYRQVGGGEALFHAYNGPRGVYERLSGLKRPGWGTYFRRLTNYEVKEGSVNQVGNIIEAINRRDRGRTFCAAYTMLIPKPGGETVRRSGGPCLNYVAVQLEGGLPRSLGLLCVYRNHDFLERAYGNYWGLCSLMNYLASETQSTPSLLTCVSSHAYVPGRKRALVSFVESM